MRELSQTFLFILNLSSALAQDTIQIPLKPTQTPTYFNQFRLLQNISSPNNTRLDIFDIYAKDKVGIPNNYAGTQELPENCKNYIGIATYNGVVTFNLKEKVEYGIVSSHFIEKGFVEISLAKKLEFGKEYNISFKISLADNSRFASSGWGASLSNTEIKNTSNVGSIIKPQINFEGIFKDKLKWVELRNNYKSKGDEKYLTIGCFDENYKFEELTDGNGFGNTKAYYFITDIKLIEIPPDGDRDGVYDLNDKCPDVFGLIRYWGCPDTDEDSIPDPYDKCPINKGLAIFGGCPDTDNDGVEDSRDKCPTLSGTVIDEGCPAVVIDENNIQEIVKTIQFDTGRENFNKNSTIILNNIVSALMAKPTLSVNVGDFIDQDANTKQNKNLSLKRANSIINYLIINGCSIKAIKYNGNGGKKDGTTDFQGGRRIEVEVNNPK